MKIRIEKSEPKNEKIEGYNPKMFRQMKFVYTLLSIINLIVVIVIRKDKKVKGKMLLCIGKSNVVCP